MGGECQLSWQAFHHSQLRLVRSSEQEPHLVEHGLTYAVAILEGEEMLEHASGEIATFRSAGEPE